MKSKFKKKVLNRYPELFYVDGFFLSKRFEHFLTGFFCEQTPSGANIWEVVYPLFDSSNRIHLTYSNIVPGGWVDFNKTLKEDLVDEFCIKIFQHIDRVRHIEELNDEFKLYIEKNSELLRNPNIRLTYSKALILLNDVENAQENLRICFSAVSKKADIEFNSECGRFLGYLPGELEKAKEEILNFERLKLLALKIPMSSKPKIIR